MLSPPVATDDLSELADWVEVQAVLAGDSTYSPEALVAVLRRSGVTDDSDDADAMEDDERGDARDSIFTRAMDAWGVLSDRARACDSAYPFVIGSNVLTANARSDDNVYAFLLLLTSAQTFGQKAIPRDKFNVLASAFERVCTVAADGFFATGGNVSACGARHFGHPRRQLSPKFGVALDQVMTLTGEVGRLRSDMKPGHTKDDGLDVVGWRGFPDALPGAVLGFGQCAAGVKHWEAKLSELQPQAFCATWLTVQPLVLPIPLFFVPLDLPRLDHERISRKGGLVFDRPRICSWVRTIGREVGSTIGAATTSLLEMVG